MVNSSSTQVFSRDSRDGTTAHDITEYFQNDAPCHPSSCSQQSWSAPQGHHQGHTRDSGQGAGNNSRPELRPLLQEKAIQNWPANTAKHITSKPWSPNQQCQTIHYVLCSTHFNDIVVIHPPNIDQIDLDDGYDIPTRKEIRNSYFKHAKHKKKI